MRASFAIVAFVAVSLPGLAAAQAICGDGTCSPDETADVCLRDCLVTCGNGVVDPFEECDDGDLDSGDGCSDLCRFESCGAALTCAYACSAGIDCGTVCGVGRDAASTVSFNRILGCLSQVCAPGSGLECAIAAADDECRAAVRACEAEEAPADITCLDVLECDRLCGEDRDCIAGCQALAGAEAAVLYGSARACFDEVCPQGAGSQLQCLAAGNGDDCADRVTACRQGPPLSDLECGDVLRCAIDSCTTDACEAECESLGTPDAVAQYVELRGCLAAECEGAADPESCLEGAVTGPCAAQLATCDAAGVCGDGDRQPAEACDDNDRRADDGCSQRCEVEPCAAMLACAEDCASFDCIEQCGREDFVAPEPNMLFGRVLHCVTTECGRPGADPAAHAACVEAALDGPCFSRLLDCSTDRETDLGFTCPDEVQCVALCDDPACVARCPRGPEAGALLDCFALTGDFDACPAELAACAGSTCPPPTRLLPDGRCGVLRCAPGSEPSSGGCRLCAPGFASPDGTECDGCDYAFYADSPGADRCEPCPEGSYTETTGILGSPGAADASACIRCAGTLTYMFLGYVPFLSDASVLLPAIVPICLDESDGDGIYDPSDGRMVNGAFESDAGVPSRHFTDIPLGGNAIGEVITPPAPGSYMIIAPVAPPDTDPFVSEVIGVYLIQDPATSSASLRVCPHTIAGGVTVHIEAQLNQIAVECGSATVSVREGPVTLELSDGTLIVVPEDGIAFIDETPGSDFVVRNDSVAEVVITVITGAGSVPLGPGTQLTIDGASPVPSSGGAGRLVLLGLAAAFAVRRLRRRGAYSVHDDS